MDAWDELRHRLGPKGVQAAEALLERLDHLRGQQGWDCSLHLAGKRDKALAFWVEPVLRIPLTEHNGQAQTDGA